MPPPRLALPSLAWQCRSLLAQPAAAATTTRFISTTASRTAPGTSSAPFSPASLLDGLDGSGSGSDSPSSSSISSTLKNKTDFWSTGGNRASSPTAKSTDRLSALLADSQTREAHRKRTAQTKSETTTSLRTQDQSNAYVRQMPRRWQNGEVYAPHDLSPEEVKRYFKRQPKPRFDVFDVLGFNPLDNYANFSVISEYMTPMGRILHRDDTGLRPANHRKIAKAIRRAIGLGLHPSVHRHPEILHRLRRNNPTARK